MRVRSRTPSGKVRWECRTLVDGEEVYCYSTTEPEHESRKRNGARGVKPKVFKRKLHDTQTYIITCAQNGTPVHPEFWACLKTMERARKANLVVIPIRYKNPTSHWEASQANEEWWVDEVQEHLCNQRKVLNENLILIGDTKTQPTAQKPLSKYESLSGSSSAIIGHPKLAFKAVPTPCNKMPKILLTTGACTVANYTDSKAGQLGKFHHTLAALVVEITSRKTFHVRQLNFDTKTKSFTDVDKRYYGDRVEKAPRALALIMGDTHTDFICEKVKSATFGKGGIVESTRPLELVWHDLLDAYMVNPHHLGNPFVAIAKMTSGLGTIWDEVQRACHFVKDHTPKGSRSVVVPSNHNDFLKRWIFTHDWKTHPPSAEFYLSTALQMVRETKFKPRFGAVFPSPLPMLFPQIVDCSNIELLSDEDPTKNHHTVAKTELSLHGDKGPNGSRGSINSFKDLGVKTVVGHSHTPGIVDGCYQVGTSTELSLEYTNGHPSSWLNTHCLLNADGKRQLITIIDGEWRA